jgi:5-methylcytosine-specific restriction endonuclease McrA
MVKRPFVKRKLSKKEVLLRDRHTCQYCGQRNLELTMDHVRPRRQGGQQTWGNIVSACIPCNHRKAGRTPREAGMRLLKTPKAPYPSPYYVLHGRTILDEWKKFIPWEID